MFRELGQTSVVVFVNIMIPLQWSSPGCSLLSNDSRWGLSKTSLVGASIDAQAVSQVFSFSACE